MKEPRNLKDELDLAASGASQTTPRNVLLRAAERRRLRWWFNGYFAGLSAMWPYLSFWGPRRLRCRL
jgi:hypothetical protein